MSLSPYVVYVDEDDRERMFECPDNLRCTVKLGDMPARGEPRPAKVDTLKWARSFDRKCLNEQRIKEKAKRK